MSVPTDRRYSESHEWYQADGNTVIMGITQYAADELTDITYVELPEVGATIEPGSPCGGVESVKAYSELYCAVPGKVIELNDALTEGPELVNEDAFGKGWMLKIEASDLGVLDGLMDAAAYESHISSD